MLSQVLKMLVLVHEADGENVDEVVREDGCNDFRARLIRQPTLFDCANLLFRSWGFFCSQARARE